MNSTLNQWFRIMFLLIKLFPSSANAQASSFLFYSTMTQNEQENRVAVNSNFTNYDMLFLVTVFSFSATFCAILLQLLSGFRVMAHLG
jgi:hypothetical protein